MSTFGRKQSGLGRLLPYLALFATWALVHSSLVLFRDVPVFEAGLMGPDSFMRMHRVAELFQTWNWFDGSVARANAPYGDVLHWTRPFDLVILGIALPLSFFLGWPEALHVAGIVVSPLLQLSTALLLVWALRPLIRPENWFLPTIALFLQPCALAYSVLGRADHHSLLLLVFVLAAGFLLRALNNPLDSRPALFAGGTIGFGLWLSVEFLLPLGLCLAALGLPWLLGERERAGQSKWFALGLSLMLLAALFAERPLAELFEPVYDEVSAVHFFIAVAVLLFWRVIESLESWKGHEPGLIARSAATLLGALAAGLLVKAAYPLFYAGPMVDVDPRILPIWLDRVLEMRPIVPVDRQTFGTFIFYLGGVTLITPLFLAITFAERRSGRVFSHLFVAACCLLLTLVAAQHMRFSGYAELAFVMAFAVVLDRFLRWSMEIGSDLVRGVLRGSLISVTLIGPILIGASLMAKESTASDAAGQPLEGCDMAQVADYLESDPRWAAAPQTILAFMDLGPELLYRTSRHRVIGTPYHRNGDGIYDGHRMLATGDAATARALAAQRRVDLVLLCHTPAERAFYASRDGSETLYQRLSEGRGPDWLQPVALPEGLEAQADLFRILP